MNRKRYVSNVLGLVALLCVFSVKTVLAQENTVTFDNQSGEPALVKLVGPTYREIQVPTGTKRSVTAGGGRYHIKVRYGPPGKYHYAKGEEFTVTETATTRSEITITLHKVVAGNYDSRPISEDEFEEVGPAETPEPGTTLSTAKEVITVDHSASDSASNARDGRVAVKVVNEGDMELTLWIHTEPEDIRSKLKPNEVLRIHLLTGKCGIYAGTYDAQGRMKRGTGSLVGVVVIEGPETWTFRLKEQYGQRVWELDQTTSSPHPPATGTDQLKTLKETTQAHLELVDVSEPSSYLMGGTNRPSPMKYPPDGKRLVATRLKLAPAPRFLRAEEFYLDTDKGSIEGHAVSFPPARAFFFTDSAAAENVADDEQPLDVTILFLLPADAAPTCVRWKNLKSTLPGGLKAATGDVTISLGSWTGPNSITESSRMKLMDQPMVVRIPFTVYETTAKISNTGNKPVAVSLGFDPASEQSVRSFKESVMKISPSDVSLCPGATQEVIVRTGMHTSWYKKLAPLQRKELENACTGVTVVITNRSETAALPKHTTDLAGGNEVRVHNPNHFSAVAGIRSQAGGKDLVVPANGVRSAYLPNGKYETYFIYLNQPEVLYQGDDFTVKDNRVEIQIKNAVGGKYGTRQVK